MLHSKARSKDNSVIGSYNHCYLEIQIPLVCCIISCVVAGSEDMVLYPNSHVLISSVSVCPYNDLLANLLKVLKF